MRNLHFAMTEIIPLERGSTWNFDTMTAQDRTPFVRHGVCDAVIGVSNLGVVA